MSITSMTGFARTEGSLGDWSWAVEARSVNGRNLEVRFRAPAGFDDLERVTREAAQARFHRGQLNVAVQAKRHQAARRPKVNIDVVDRYLACGDAFLAAGRASTPSLDGLLALPGVIEMVEDDEDGPERAAVSAAIGATIVQTLEGLAVCRVEEGATIGAVLAGFLARIDVLTDAARSEAAAQPSLIKARFERRLTELVGERVDTDRILQEAATMATRADVTEELDRLSGHIAAASGLLKQDAAAGRRLDFLTQEFMREANTLCSKSASAELTVVGLDLKAVIDQFREQVQNVE
jgi:uncharacterized protein (TIGR00255 family)